ncbi:MAG: carbon starvation protein A [Acidobacteria bacterium]|nr:carbon starvation protein A [Acidobacteriota bacterium]
MRYLLWAAVAVAGALAFGTVALSRGETVSAAYLVLAAVCVYLIAYRFYSLFIARRVFRLDDANVTPAYRHNDGRDFVPTNRWVVFGHHFAAIAGPGPLIGPVLAAQFGYLPGTIWILVGVVLGGAVQDMVILVASLRRDGRSLAKMARDYLGRWGALAATLGILLIMVILIAVLGLVVVNALAESPWGVFTVGATIPIAMAMGLIMRGGHGRQVWIATGFGLVLLLGALVGGHYVAEHPTLGPAFTLPHVPLGILVIVYGLAASILPVWLLLAPRDYLSTFVKLGTIFALAGGILAVRPDLHLPAVTQFANGTGPIFGGKIFPFCFITIACGAISGFHALIASGTTPKLLKRETDARTIGYGAMLLESFVAIMAMIAAASLPPGQYFAINTNRPLEWISQQGYPVTQAEMELLAERVGERSVIARTGGAPCLAVGMAEIFHRFLGGPQVAALWYHFAIMFEALFILTTLDAGTRVGRYILQDALARAAPRIAGSSWSANVATSVVFVAAWGYFLMAGVIDPHGGIRALWPLFGIANQLLAATALTIGTTILFRTGKKRFAWITLVPLVFLLAVTMTAGVEYVLHPDPRIGFLARAGAIESGAIAVDEATRGIQAFNARLDAVLAGVFLVLVATVVISALREWRHVLAGRRPIEPDPPLVPASGGGGLAFGEVPPSAGGMRCC